MENNLVGYRFSPTGEELINHYLKNKILGKSWLVDHAISEVNICRYEPWFLPSLSKLESKDLVWYFFSPKEYTSAKKNVTKRTTPSGYWKATGVDRKIKDWRGNGVEIGIKKTLVYYEGRVPNGVWTPWVLHEYHITSLPLNQRTYVICQVMYKGDDGDSLYGNNSNEPSSSMVSDSNPVKFINTSPEVVQKGQEDGMSMYDLLIPLNQQVDLSPYDVFNPNKSFTDNSYYPQTPYGDDYWNRLLDYNGGNFEDVFRNQELTIQENQSNHRPKRPLTGIIVDDSCSDSDAESISATSYRGTSSPGDSDGSVDEILSLMKGSSKDILTSINGNTRESRFTRRTIPSKQEVKEGKSKANDDDASMDKKALSPIMKTEKKGWFITEEAIQRNHKNAPYIYFMNMIIGLILLVAVIGNII
ncbi:PREDICTED: NAC domain-containing protein 69-like isoform X2 [Brassica oleracea var. oleracea]|uniref:NAC domain-containing protein n=1 Tax=Brassica oleracea var. oleracea TaxID=109376 RepID=A0A0D2ZRM6_BRAOL|nr:PREDICTED: NAC domain-containing protein 69-like isoform X2 [Brassica oleracea var. oleracea]